MQREHHIDWLRTIAILSLIPFHVFAYYADTRFALKTGEIDPLFNYLYYFLEQWRLALLFFISGYCAQIFLSKYSAKKFIIDKVKRILIPLIAGSLIIIPPQVYIEKIRFGTFSGSYFEFIPHILSGIYPDGNSSWGHLWFLFYLFFYMFLYYVGINRVQHFQFRTWYLLFPVLTEIMLRPYFPSFPNFITDYANIFVFGFYFLYGIKFRESNVQLFIEKYHSIILPLTGMILILTPFFYQSIFYPLLMAIRTLSMVSLLPGIAQKYFSFDHAFIQFFKFRNYPLYILHHTAIILIAEPLLASNHWIFLVVVSMGSFLLSILLIEILKQIKWGRIILGMKWSRG